MKISFLIIAALLFVSSCKKEPDVTGFPAPLTKSKPSIDGGISLSREEYYDKILGVLVGSAIGDAMGAPSEMWDRKSIKIYKGYVDSLGPLVQGYSPEGQWATNMPGGSTTDDTRWKYFAVDFLVTQQQDSLNPYELANHIVKIYNTELNSLSKETKTYSTIEDHFSHLSWLIEWVKVAKPFATNDMFAYQEAISRFYGGEMSCAGMLYSPMIGAYFPGKPNQSYQQAFHLSIFDIGYARDITALTAAYVSKAMEPNVKYQSITRVTQEIDPYDYFKSRLVSRIALKAYWEAQRISYEAKLVTEKDLSTGVVVPEKFRNNVVEFIQLQKAYELLDDRMQDIPFHAGEIHLINLTALEFSGGDFVKALEFVANFGRDNDTVGAVTGAILGGYWGFKKLPAHLTSKALKINREVVGIDLEIAAKKMTDHKFPDKN